MQHQNVENYYRKEKRQLYKWNKTVPLETTIRMYRLRWAGHVRRMQDSRLPKMVLFGRLIGEEKLRGRPVKNWEDCLKEDCEHANIMYGAWTATSANRTEWLKLISSLTCDNGK